MHGSEDVGTKNVVRGLHLAGFKRELLDATLKEGTSNYTRDGEERHLVPPRLRSPFPKERL
jgi:hypothetical protein